MSIHSVMRFRFTGKFIDCSRLLMLGRINPGIIARPFLFFIFLIVLTGCSPTVFIIDRVGNSFGSAGDLYLTEDDPELVREAFPFNLKAIELLIQQSPENSNLLTAAASGFTMYGYAYIMEDADRMAVEDIAASRRLYKRAEKLMLRGRNYGLRSLESQVNGFGAAFKLDPVQAVGMLEVDQIDAMYWMAAAQAGAIIASQGNPQLLIDLPEVGYLFERIMELDSDWGNGTIYSAMMSYELSRPDMKANSEEIARKYFQKAIEISAGKDCSLYVSAAETFSIRNQNREEFIEFLQTAIDFDVDSAPENRLSNLLAQDRARWLLSREDELFY